MGDIKIGGPVYPQGIGPEWSPTWTGTGALVLCLGGWWFDFPLEWVVPIIVIPAALLMIIQNRNDGRHAREYLQYVRERQSRRG